MKSSTGVLLLMLLAGCSVLIPNRHDSQGLRHGRWVVRWSDGSVMWNGKFQHGVQTGKWKYFSIDGIIERKEKYKGNEVYTTFFQNGVRELEGVAYQYGKGDSLKYIWQGVWNSYNNNQYQYSLLYRDGLVIDTLKLQ